MSKAKFKIEPSLHGTIITFQHSQAKSVGPENAVIISDPPYQVRTNKQCQCLEHTLEHSA